MVAEFDSEKDYYKVLGLKPDATMDELKAAYVNLALKHHPDTSTTSTDQFILISEAWGVLSKPLLKGQYDAIRGYTARGSRGSTSTGSSTLEAQLPPETEIFQGFTVQQSHFATSVMPRSSRVPVVEMQDKYKVEKWQNLPLSERKMHRSRPITTAGKSLVSMFIPIALCGMAFYGIYSYTFQPKATSKSKH